MNTRRVPEFFIRKLPFQCLVREISQDFKCYMVRHLSIRISTNACKLYLPRAVSIKY
ncbi:hypothetical protein MTR_1g040770 [Medicago truncatula]|uniref:Uncharacterized protein n=1 Tax=Medicago truncatula TaxID=3880 RepID=G7I2F5_MEDTR|nr:hypothetical protein MTR_1g040770 [Medicago truncatula]